MQGCKLNHGDCESLHTISQVEFVKWLVLPACFCHAFLPDKVCLLPSSVVYVYRSHILPSHRSSTPWLLVSCRPHTSHTAGSRGRYCHHMSAGAAAGGGPLQHRVGVEGHHVVMQDWLPAATAISPDTRSCQSVAMILKL